jgi:hypothetical protein
MRTNQSVTRSRGDGALPCHKCVSPARTAQGGLGLYEASTPCVSQHSSYEGKGEQKSMGLLQPIGIPSLTQSHHFSPFQKPNTRERLAPGHALHAMNKRTHYRQRTRVRAVTATATSMHHYFDEQETARVLPEREGGWEEEDEEQRRRRRAGGYRAFPSPASALYITEQGSRGSGRYGG